MPHYSGQFAELKPLVETGNFTPEQLTIVNRLMRGCWKLRTAQLCTNALEYALPDAFEVVQDTDHPIEGMNGKTWYKTFIIEKGGSIPKSENDELNEQTKKAIETGVIQ